MTHQEILDRVARGMEEIDAEYDLRAESLLRERAAKKDALAAEARSDCGDIGHISHLAGHRDATDPLGQRTRSCMVCGKIDRVPVEVPFESAFIRATEARNAAKRKGSH